MHINSFVKGRLKDEYGLFPRKCSNSSRSCQKMYFHRFHVPIIFQLLQDACAYDKFRILEQSEKGLTLRLEIL